MSDNNEIPYGPKQKAWHEQVPDYADVSGPLENPIDIYPSVPEDGLDEKFPELDYKKFELSPQGLNKRERMEALNELKAFAQTQHINFSGFQANENLDLSQLSWLLDMHANNVGDPYSNGYFTLNMKLVERAVLDYFAALWNAHWPHQDANTTERYPERYWGYVMSMGSTEGNLYGIYNARNYLNGGMLMEDEYDSHHSKKNRLKRGKKVSLRSPLTIQPKAKDYYNDQQKKVIRNKYIPVSFYSEDSHYSVIKSMNVMQVSTFSQYGNKHYPKKCPITEDGIWPSEVPSHDNVEASNSGTINVKDLKELLRFFLEKGHPPLIVLNVGSTWKGAYDNVEEINKMLKELGKDFPELWERKVTYEDEKGKKWEDTRRSFWVHVDGALGAPFLPFIEMAHNQQKRKIEKPVIFDFRNDAVMSICCSMHKWIGAPWPGGIYMTKNKYQLKPPSTAGYIGSADTTFGGSRDAFSPVILWLEYARKSYQDNIEKALNAIDEAERLVKKLKDLETKIRETDPEADLWIHRSEFSLAITFKMVNPTIAYKFTVDGERLDVPIDAHTKEERTYAHIFSMESLEKFKIVDIFIDYVSDICGKDGWKKAFPSDEKLTIDKKPNPGPRTPI